MKKITPQIHRMSTKLGARPHPLIVGVVLVALAASAAFMTPFSHKANLIVMGAGGYRVIDYLKLNGHGVLDRPERAEYIIVNTCAFVDVQRRKVMETLQSLSAAAPSAKLIIMGCAGDIAPDCLEPYNIDMVLGHYDLDRLDELFAGKVKFSEIPAFAKHLTLPNIVIVAARGCVGTCSYCSIVHDTVSMNNRQRIISHHFHGRLADENALVLSIIGNAPHFHALVEHVRFKIDFCVGIHFP